MPRPVPNLAGRRFGRLVAREQTAWIVWANARARAWQCECDCGGNKRVAAKNLLYGRTLSCGCLKREQCVAMGCPVLGADGTLYPSQHEAARRLGVHVNTVRRRLDAGRPVDGAPLSGRPHPVVGPEGRFASVRGAARSLGLDHVTILNRLADPASGWRRA